MIYLPESEEKTETSPKTFFGASPGVPAPLTLVALSFFGL